MGWKAENNRHLEESRVVLQLRAVDLTKTEVIPGDIQDLPYVYMNPEELAQHPAWLAKAERNSLFMFPRTHPQFVARVKMHEHVPRGEIALNPTQLRNFELTADGLETFPWSSYDMVDSLDSLQNLSESEGYSPPTIFYILPLTAVELEIHPLMELQVKEDLSGPLEIDGKRVIKLLSTILLGHIITLHERISLTVDGVRCLLRVIDLTYDDEEEEMDFGSLPEGVVHGSGEKDDLFRGLINPRTKLYVKKNPGRFEDKFRLLNNPERPPKEQRSANQVKIICNDDNWFPVAKDLLRPCLSLTKYVRDQAVETPEIRVNIDCCTFDRVLLFLLAEQRQKEFKFPLEELDLLLNAAQELKLLSLRRLCESRRGEFERRIRTEGVSLDEVFKRNAKGETLLLIDGMVFDVTEWLPEHPGGNYIIPTQALNKNATVFFELYHASKESFVYLKQLYIGQLHSQDIPKVPEPSANYAKPSPIFLEQLREYMRPDNLKNYKSF